MPITRASLPKTTSLKAKNKKKKKFQSKGAKDRAKATAKTKAILSQQRGEASPYGKVVMRGFVKKLYDKIKNKK